MVNPAFTGVFNGDLRIIGNARDQWEFAAPYRTFSLSTDGAIADLRNGDFASMGVQLIGDQAGDLDFTTLQSNVTFAYSKALGGYGNHFLTLGFQAGMTMRSINFANAVSFDPEPFDQNYYNHFTYLDLATGFTWYFLPSPEIYVYFGGSMYHFNQPNQSFLNDGSDVLQRRVSLQGGFQFPLSDKVSLLPSFIFNSQGPHTEIVAGSYLKYKLSHVTVMNETAVYAGVWYRNQDAVVASVRYDLNNYFVGLSYDFNVSELTPASQGRGGLELSFIYILDKKFNSTKRMRNRSIQCPKF